MKSILLIGLGRFGRNTAKKLSETGVDVLAVDKNEDNVNKTLEYVSLAQIGDSTNSDFLKSLGIRNFDVCIVAIGDDFQSSLETTSLLKELGANHVVSRASSERQAKLLLKIGADEIYTQTWSGNVRMIRCAEKLGFVECNRNIGTREVDGQCYDGLTFRLEE